MRLRWKNGWRNVWSGDRGSASTAIGVLIFLPLLALGMGAMRIVQMNGDVESAARSGARAASLTYTLSAAAVETEAVVAESLGDRGVSCVNLAVNVVRPTTVDIEPGSTVLVEVTCEVDMSSSFIAGFPGTRTITVEAASQVDNLRGGGVFEETP